MALRLGCRWAEQGIQKLQKNPRPRSGEEGLAWSHGEEGMETAIAISRKTARKRNSGATDAAALNRQEMKNQLPCCR